jgi:purine nucleosidase
MIWIDTDGGVDDALALAVASKIVPPRGLVISTVYGNVSAKQAAFNVQRLMELLGVQVPVLVGAESALDGFVHQGTAIHGTDGVGNLIGPFDPHARFSRLHDELSRYSAQGGNVRILAIGPATNIPAIIEAVGKDRIAQVTVMAGAILDRGNTTPDAEFNLYNDPEALARVIASGVPLTIVPLDICRKVILAPDQLPGLAAFGKAEDMLVHAHQFYMARYKDRDRIDGCFPHDTIALLSMMYPSRFDFWQLPFELDLAGDSRGKMRFRLGGKYSARFCLGGDLKWVRRLFDKWSLPTPEIDD